MGLASLAGINLYLTVGLVGLAVRYQWIELDPRYVGLEVLEHPALLITAWVFFLLEFFADKVPWIDSSWDALQSFIRPIGAACLGLAALGTLDPAFAWAGAILAGGTALTTHLGKAGVRLASNLNPEPTTNAASSVALSTAEDGIVLGGLALTALSPWLAFVIFLVLVLLSFYVVRKCALGFKALARRLFNPKSSVN